MLSIPFLNLHAQVAINALLTCTQRTLSLEEAEAQAKASIGNLKQLIGQFITHSHKNQFTRKVARDNAHAE